MCLNFNYLILDENMSPIPLERGRGGPFGVLARGCGSGNLTPLGRAHGVYGRAARGGEHGCPGTKKIMEQAVPLGMEFQDELRWQEARMEKKK